MLLKVALVVLLSLHTVITSSTMLDDSDPYLCEIALHNFDVHSNILSVHILMKGGFWDCSHSVHTSARIAMFNVLYSLRQAQTVHTNTCSTSLKQVLTTSACFRLGLLDNSNSS